MRVGGGLLGSLVANNLVLFASCVVVCLPVAVPIAFRIKGQSVATALFRRFLKRGHPGSVNGYDTEPAHLKVADILSPAACEMLNAHPRKFSITGEERHIVIAIANPHAGGPSGSSMSDVRSMIGLGLAISEVR